MRKKNETVNGVLSDVHSYIIKYALCLYNTHTPLLHCHLTDQTFLLTVESYAIETIFRTYYITSTTKLVQWLDL